jgi:hypothetical protein
LAKVCSSGEKIANYSSLHKKDTTFISGEKIANHSSLPSPVTQLLQSAVAISENLGNLPPLSRGRIPPSPSQEL